MKTYPVYAIGTAIVDHEYRLHRGIQFPAGIERGGTVLIDADMEQALLNGLANLTPHRSCGGTSANTLSLISGLGRRVFTSCKVANDEAGDLFHQSLLAHSIESNLDGSAKVSGETGHCLILIDPDAERSLFTQLGINRTLSVTDLNKTALLDCDYLFVETFLATAPSSKATALAAIRLAKEAGCNVALTLSTCKIPGFSRDHLTDFAEPGLDLLFCNEMEAAYFCGTEDIREITEKLATLAASFVITRGARPTLLFDGRNCIEIPTYPTTTVNTTGAGDAFAGAFLHGLTTGMNFTQAGTLGNLAAAQVVRNPGARLNGDDLKQVKEQIKFL